MMFELDFRESNTGGAVVPGRLTRGTEDQLRWAGHIVFLLHGFNVDRQEGRDALHALAMRLPSMRDAALVAVLWPGDHWSGALSYSFEGRDADDTGKELARYIVRTLPRGTRISFASHSLGARVILHAMRYLRNYGFRAEQICMMAAAIDDTSLAAPSEYLSACDATRRLTVLASRKDRVLQLAYPAGDWLQSFLFWRREEYGQALGYHGPRARRTNPVPNNVLHYQIADTTNVGHTDYMPDTPINRKQEDAAAFCNQVLRGDRLPTYG